MKTLRTMLSNIKFSQAKLYLIHCFDPRPLWLKIWTVLCIKGILLARIPLAGASAKGKHYLKYFEEHQANKETPVVVATHYPCGWYEGQPEEAVIKHGKEVVDHLRENGMKAIHLHFTFIKVEGKITCTIYDPGKLLESDKIVGLVVEAANSIEAGKYTEGLRLEREIEIVVIAQEVYGPPAGEGKLVVVNDFMLGKTLQIAQDLNGGDEPIKVTCTAEFYVPNYADDLG